MQFQRRKFLAGGLAAAGSLLLPKILLGQERSAAGKRPNILWLTAEDLSPFLNSYGDPIAKTPVLDKLAAEGVQYTRAFANSPVCAPARFTLATGMYPVCFGEAQDMRAKGHVPETMPGYVTHLRKAGYHCTNHDKRDYNSDVLMDWTYESQWRNPNPKAHWRSRQDGQPFFSVFNYGVTHESCLRSRPDDVQTPEGLALPPYYPDHEEIREDQAWVYQRIESLDFQLGRILQDLEDDGLADDTIVFFYGDHGGILPWSKRWLYDRGTQVPLLVRFGKNFRHLAPAGPGETVDRLVSFVDFAPTVLSLCGAEIPAYMQGRPFLGDAAPAPECVHLNRGRMDERYDLMRGVRDEKYLYIRNYWPFIPHGQRMYTPWRIRTMQVWQDLHDRGELNELQDRFFQPKPYEELFDVNADPHQMHNLAGRPEHADALATMRNRADRFALTVVDTGYHRSGVGEWGYHAQREGSYPLERILETTKLAAAGRVESLPTLRKRLNDEDPDVRFWATCGCRTLGQGVVESADAVAARLDDAGAMTQVTAAETLYVLGRRQAGLNGLARYAGNAESPACLWALNAVDRLGLAEPLRDEIEKAHAAAQANRGLPHARYIARLAEYLLEKN
jgi:arylsulfatase A-like enzyme